jgi:hypothetical protein
LFVTHLLQRLPPDMAGATLSPVILFPIALVWLVIALVWILRNSTNEPDRPDEPRSWRRFVPRPPRRPWNDGSRSRQARGTSARSR